MKTWICTTLTSILGPMQGPARLYAYARQQGLDVELQDYNQDAYFTLLSAEYLNEACERASFALETIKRNKFLREDMGAIIDHGSSHAMKQLLARGLVLNSGWRGLAKLPGAFSTPLLALIGTRLKHDNLLYALLSQKDYVISEIQKSREILYREFLRLPPDEFVKHFASLLWGKAIIDMAYFPALLDFGLGFHGTAYSPRSGDIRQAVQDERHNFMLSYFRKKVVPVLKAEQPGLVGISITHASEFIPAFTLASLVKSASPGTHICLGGAALTEVSHRLAKNPALWSYCDSLVLGPGEYPLVELIAGLEAGRPLSAVPNLIYKENGSIKRSEKVREFDLNDACTPEYVAVRPRSTLPLETSSGCYWGKCAFCYYPREGTASFSPAYQKNRIRRIELVLADMARLKERYDPIYIGLTDSALPPRRIEQIAEYNLKNPPPVPFSAFFRFEKEFARAEYCRKVAAGGFIGGQVGLETGSQRVNDLINKGIDLEQAAAIFRNFRACGILLHLYSIVGLPTETREEALMTYRFIRRWHRYLTLDWQIYALGITEHGPLAARAAEFGLELQALPDDYLLQVMQYKMSRGLSQPQSAGLAIMFSEKLKRYLHPLNKIMDPESRKVVHLAREAYFRSPLKEHRGYRPESTSSVRELQSEKKI